jgi:polysaccharide export outer membrane protein
VFQAVIRRKSYMRLSIALCVAFPFLLAGCSDASMTFPVSESAQTQLPPSIDVVRLDGHNVATFGSAAAGSAKTTLPVNLREGYQIGPGDVIAVFVFDHPELAMPEDTGVTSPGFLVQPDGALNYPIIGVVNAQGMSVEALRAEIAERLSEFMPNPQVNVRVSAYNSQRVVVGGEVEHPNTQSVQDVPLTLLEAVNGAGGIGQSGDARSVTVRRGGKNYTVDLDAFLSEGLARNNPDLVGGDVVFVPRRKLREAYILGEVGRPATIDLSTDTLSLTQAITRQGGLNESRADARGVFVFRMYGDRIRVFQLDTTTPIALLFGTRFLLEPMDVIYVTKSPMQRWNDTITKVLPSVNAFRTAETVGR